jgi:hypothetical protein
MVMFIEVDPIPAALESVREVSTALAPPVPRPREHLFERVYSLPEDVY